MAHRSSGGQTQPVGFNSVAGWRPDRLRAARQAKGWTQAELATRLGVSRDAIGQWEAARAPRPDRVAQLAAALDVAPDYLADLGGLRALRVQAGMTQLALAKAAQVPRSTVQGVEQGLFRINGEVAAAYAEALGVPVAVVLEAAGRPGPVAESRPSDGPEEIDSAPR